MPMDRLKVKLMVDDGTYVIPSCKSAIHAFTKQKSTPTCSFAALPQELATFFHMEKA